MKLEGYEIVEKVAEGGTAAVYKARQLSLNRVVALKVLFDDALQDQDQVDRFHEIETKGVILAVMLNMKSVSF